jgi:transposase
MPREQLILFYPTLEDALPQDHPVRVLEFLLRQEPFASTFREMEKAYALDVGRPPFHPRYLTGLYLYGMMNGIRSSRKLEAACWNRLDVRWLMEGQQPDHDTISVFVTTHQKALKRLFRDTVSVSRRAGLIKLKHESVDGTKVEADAGKGSVRKEEALREWQKKLEEEVAALESEWQRNEEQERGLYGPEVPWAPAGAGTESERLERMGRQRGRVVAALAAMERRKSESEASGSEEAKGIVSMTDPESRVMRDKEGRRKPNYNAQIAVDAEAGVITAADVNDNPSDSGQMSVMLKQVQENCGDLPAEVSADSQYNTGSELKTVEEMKVASYLPESGQRSEVEDPASASSQALAAAGSGQVLSEEQWGALPKDHEGRITHRAFRYDGSKDVHVCPMGQELVFVRTSRDRRKSGVVHRRQYGRCAGCATCVRASMCCKDARKGRMINREEYEDYRERLRERMGTAEGRERYGLRGQTVEPRFGLIKRVLGVRRFMRRGLEAVRTEWMMVCTVLNLGVLMRNQEQVVAALKG